MELMRLAVIDISTHRRKGSRQSSNRQSDGGTDLPIRHGRAVVGAAEAHALLAIHAVHIDSHLHIASVCICKFVFLIK